MTKTALSGGDRRARQRALQANRAAAGGGWLAYGDPSALSATEAVMTNVDKGFYYGVEDVAKFIWDALTAPLSVAALCDRIMAHYAHAEQATCEQEVLAFVGELLAENLVDVHPNTAAA